MLAYILKYFYKVSNYLQSPLLYFVFRIVQPFYSCIFGLIFINIYFAVHLSLQPYAVKVILDAISINPSLSKILLPILFYVVLMLILQFFQRLYDYLNLKFYPKVKANIISEVADKISRCPYGFFQDQLAGSISNKIKDMSRGITEIIFILWDRGFSNILALCIASFVLAKIHILLTCIFLTWALLFIIISCVIAPKVRFLAHKFSESNSFVSGKIVDRFSNILNVQLFSTFSHEQFLLKQGLTLAINKEQKLRLYLIRITLIQGVCTIGMVCGCLFLLAYHVNSKNITVGDFGLVLTLILSFSDMIFRFSIEILHISEAYGLVNQGLKLLEFYKPEKTECQNLKITEGAIKFHNVHFQYPNSKILFKNLSTVIRAGQKVGIVGSSGSGKSTFLNLILRLFEVNNGQILIDEQDIKNISVQSLHQAIALIPQDPILFHRSLMDNIRYSCLTASDEEVFEAAKRAQAHEFISTLKEGYNTIVGERGIKLSGGQKQRISIARAILMNPPILLLDEATSALDSVTENLVRGSLYELMKGKTTIVVAHRVHTLLNMDRILVFHQGSIVETGTHNELLSKKGNYKMLWDGQKNGFIQNNRKIFVRSIPSVI